MQKALRWLRSNNHLYSDVYAHFETLYRFQPRSVLLNPSLLEHLLEDLLQQEAIGMVFPSSSNYFDQFPAIHSIPQVLGIQHPCKDHCMMFLEPKLFPHIHLFGFGGWYSGCSINFSDHVKM